MQRLWPRQSPMAKPDATMSLSRVLAQCERQAHLRNLASVTRRNSIFDSKGNTYAMFFSVVVRLDWGLSGDSATNQLVPSLLLW
jgi:hypothetical protein